VDEISLTKKRAICRQKKTRTLKCSEGGMGKRSLKREGGGKIISESVPNAKEGTPYQINLALGKKRTVSGRKQGKESRSGEDILTNGEDNWGKAKIHLAFSRRGSVVPMREKKQGKKKVGGKAATTTVSKKRTGASVC